ncbi:adenosylhomocysteinase [Candidatus Roizmanbacteria bacterium CG22_combo_CG10-13_8_21_14_all_38_20]|uniref:Adenosylhomocysteinase n=1 Tax=Candidatus Roizmanbacteria bacterium CG22_combo_CG10-13_8_21_14_all_38_20 TaxID=1974862 RepID=A0A2H0BW88_9BACT|nr:adenosylhomocysteinase [Candidatus Microgenomates bacterium]PIP61809.1 MAG: adenosylhomocysteinase [Candidatus Roizmanbacteria bacterium CG22_combo_CG10-13_8_21_14_all_38_20]PJC31654.1 MAG: adenosylhomocysteinase [Candidatus Roizmanbacteria bacterium CG_4_9_14_0_2_um_filter_38_17]
MDYDIKDIKLRAEGKKRILWAKQRMPVLATIGERFSKNKTLKGLKIGACLHVTTETANLMITLKCAGADVYLCASNPLSTQDDTAASLVKDYKIPVFAIHGEDNKTYYKHLKSVLDKKPNITMDDGADLVTALHKLKIDWAFYGSSEETTTGVIRLKAMANDNALKIPVLAVNDSYTKYMFDNRYGTGQSTIDGILRATNILLAGKRVVVAGYGWCGRGFAARVKGMGAHVIVTEVDPIRALEATMDGFEVMPMNIAVKTGDLFVTLTGDKSVITLKHLKAMKDGAIVANSGHFNVEIEMNKLEKAASSKKEIRENTMEYTLGKKHVYILGEGRLINLAAAEGHPAEVMDMSFANQALAAEWFYQNRGKLKPQVYKLSKKLDNEVASLKLKAMGVKFDRLTPEQKKYLNSWQEGT